MPGQLKCIHTLHRKPLAYLEPVHREQLSPNQRARLGSRHPQSKRRLDCAIVIYHDLEVYLAKTR
jgi:hypothetical protein